MSAAIPHVHSPMRLRPHVPHMQMISDCRSFSSCDRGTIRTAIGLSTCCAKTGADGSSIRSSNSDVVAAPAGNCAPANANALSGSRARPVPIAITPNPNQIQFTSGLTVMA